MKNKNTNTKALIAINIAMLLSVAFVAILAIKIYWHIKAPYDNRIFEVKEQESDLGDIFEEEEFEYINPLLIDENGRPLNQKVVIKKLKNKSEEARKKEEILKNIIEQNKSRESAKNKNAKLDTNNTNLTTIELPTVVTTATECNKNNHCEDIKKDVKDSKNTNNPSSSNTKSKSNKELDSTLDSNTTKKNTQISKEQHQKEVKERILRERVAQKIEPKKEQNKESKETALENNATK